MVGLAITFYIACAAAVYAFAYHTAPVTLDPVKACGNHRTIPGTGQESRLS